MECLVIGGDQEVCIIGHESYQESCFKKPSAVSDVFLMIARFNQTCVTGELAG